MSLDGHIKLEQFYNEYLEQTTARLSHIFILIDIFINFCMPYICIDVYRATIGNPLNVFFLSSINLTIELFVF